MKFNKLLIICMIVFLLISITSQRKKSKKLRKNKNINSPYFLFAKLNAIANIHSYRSFTQNQDLLNQNEIVKDSVRLIYGFIPEKEIFVISFRGTKNAQNWIANLQVNMLPIDFCGNKVNVHQGFYSSYLLVKETLRSVVQNIITTNFTYEQLVFTGHSLGGALTNIASLDINCMFIELNNASKKI